MRRISTAGSGTMKDDPPPAGYKSGYLQRLEASGSAGPVLAGIEAYKQGQNVHMMDEAMQAYRSAKVNAAIEKKRKRQVST